MQTKPFGTDFVDTAAAAPPNLRNSLVAEGKANDDEPKVNGQKQNKPECKYKIKIYIKILCFFGRKLPKSPLYEAKATVNHINRDEC